MTIHPTRQRNSGEWRLLALEEDGAAPPFIKLPDELKIAHPAAD